MKFIQQINRYFRQCFALCLLCLIPAMLSAATVDDLNFTSINNDTEYYVSAKDSASIAGALTIPATHNGKPVTAVSFKNCSALTSVDLSQTALISIEEFTFFGCSSLSSVTLPNTLTSIEQQAFYLCTSLTSVDLSQTALISIDYRAFSECYALTSVTLPNTLTSIGQQAFQNCSALTSVDLSQSALISIGERAFQNCSALTSIDLSQSALTSIGQEAFYDCGKLTSMTFPNTLTSIGNKAFFYTLKLASVTFLGSAPTLGVQVFEAAGYLASGGLTFTIYKEHEASYTAWGTGYTFNVVPSPSTNPVILVIKTRYNPTSKALSLITKNEPSSATIHLQHTDSLSGAWIVVGTTDYSKVSDSTSGAVTRTLTLDPATKATGFYRLNSASANP